MIGLTHVELDQVRADVAELIPAYNVKKLDPLAALEARIGNCYAKAVVASGIIAIRHGVTATVAYSERLHATEKAASMLGKTNSKNFAHIATLVPSADTDRGEEYVPSLCFGIRGKEGVKIYEQDLGDILDYNDVVTRVAVQPDSGLIVANEIGLEERLLVTDWKTGADAYLEALGREPVNFEKLIATLEEKGVTTAVA